MAQKIMKSGKAIGPDGLHVEVRKCLGEDGWSISCRGGLQKM